MPKASAKVSSMRTPLRTYSAMARAGQDQRRATAVVGQFLRADRQMLGAQAQVVRVVLGNLRLDGGVEFGLQRECGALRRGQQPAVLDDELAVLEHVRGAREHGVAIG